MQIMPDTMQTIRNRFAAQPFTVKQALEAGVTYEALKHAVVKGRMRRLGQGVFAAAVEESYLDRVRAAALSHPGAVVSHGSAAALHGMWCPWPSGWRDVTLCAQKSHRLFAGARLLRRALDPHDSTVVDGVACTTPARTALDLAAQTTLPEALVLVDSYGRLTRPTRRQSLDPAFRHRIREELLRATARMRNLRGVDRARYAAALADPAAESAPESYARGLILAAGLPAPVVGRPIRGADDRTYYVDLCWPDQRIVLEVDGALKYQQRADVIGEKRREDAIRLAGWRPFRAMAADLWTRPDDFLARLEERQAA